MIKSMKMGTKSRRIERGCGLETLWIGLSERKDTRTIQYPGNFTVRKDIDKDRELASIYICKAASVMHRSRQVAVDGNQGCDSRIRFPGNTLPPYQGM